MEELYKKIIETVPVFFFLWSCDKKETIFISDKFYDQRAHDYFAPEESREDLRQYMHKESQQSYDEFFANLSEENHYNNEIELRASEGLPHIKWLKISTFPVINDGKEIEFIAGHISDVTHAKEHSRFLEDQVESLDTVAFMLAHELSSPITNIMGLTEVLKDRATQAKDTKHLSLYDSIYNFSGEVLTLARGMVSLLELQSYKNELSIKEILLKPFVDKLIHDFYLNPSTKKISLITDGIDREMYSWVNPEKFGKAIEELLVYLLKYIKPNGTISFVSPPQPEAQTILCITVEGISLPLKPVNRILDRSSRLSMLDVTGQKTPGMLELIVAKEIVELHQGHLTLYQDSATQGFKIELPSNLEEIGGTGAA